jgi:hypothetical protein
MGQETDAPVQNVNEPAYEPPELVVLGPFDKLTAVEDGSLHDESDRLLKANVEPVGRPLERLRAIRTL